MPGIIIFGPNGSGKTTLAREVARLLRCKHMDIEDYYFEESPIPYTAPRPREEVLRLMLADIERHGTFVLSACTGNFGDAITRQYRLGVYLCAPLELRVARVVHRSEEQFGARVREGGDMYEKEQEFMEFVRTRSLDDIEQFAAALFCPVLRVDGTKSIGENAVLVLKTYNSTPERPL